MRIINVDKKTGFKINDPYKPVVIRDMRGLEFYSTEPILPRATKFNMPGLGKFIVESGDFSPLPEPIEYPLLSLPGQERNMGSPFDFEIRFANNPHKCTIDFKGRTITFDYSFQEKPLPQFYYVLYHEFAHQYFKSEKYTDVLATNYMLKKGFNPYQIGRAHVLSLSSNQHYRKKYNLEKMINETQ